MTPQEIMQKFMAELNANNYTYDTTSVGTKILDEAVRSSSKFTNAQDIKTQMLADQIEAEKLAVKEILGSSYAGQTISQVSTDILNAAASTYNSDYSGTVQYAIERRKAAIFLEDYCGIILDNDDTGAITGSDANITLTAGDVVNGTTLTAANLSALKSKYGTAASLSGDTLVIGTGVEKTEYSVVPEDGDMYLFKATSGAKNINTGSKGWVVNATSGKDTITSGGRDSINAGAGSDKIIANADEATITTGAGSDTVEISAAVKSVTITDLDSSDTLTISGTFEVGNAQIENSMLVVTDTTGTRKIKFSDLTNAGNAKIGAETISEWLSNSGFDINNLSSVDSASGDVSADGSDAGRVAIDPNYKPATLENDFANQDAATQEISSGTEIKLDEVTIENGTVTQNGTTVGTVSTVAPAVMNFTTRGLTIHVGDGTATSYDQLTSSQKMMVASLFKWWASESLNLNEDSYNLGFESDTAKVTDITLSFEYLGSSTLALVNSSYRTGDDQVVQLQLKISTAYYNSYTEDDKNGIPSSSGAGFLDRTLAHEFTHAVMSTNINNFAYLPQFIKEGMAELTHGIDDERGNEIFELAYNSSSLSSALNFNDIDTGDSVAYSGGYMFLRYFARQAALQTLNDNFAPDDITATVNLGTGNATYYVSGNSTLETATTSQQNISLGSASGSTYTVGNTGVNQMINTGSTAKNIVGVNHKASVTGGAGNDTIQFIEGTFIDAGNGNNSIVGSGQFATITAGTGDDSVLVDGSSNSIALGDGKNLASLGSSAQFSFNNTITAGAGNDTVINLGTQQHNLAINLGDGNNSISFGEWVVDSSIKTGTGNDFISAPNENSTIQTGDGNDTIDFVYINATNNLIDLGAGNDSVNYVGINSTIDMGAGDDYIGQSDGNNVFLFNAESGSDTIQFFNSSDKLVIDGDYSVTTGQVYSNGYTDFVVSVIKDASVVGTINLVAADSNFSSLDNIVTAETADEPEENSLLKTLTDDANYYENTLEGATIQALGGDDEIVNVGANVLIDGGEGDNAIYNGIFLDEQGTQYHPGGDNVSVKTGAGNDYILNLLGEAAKIETGDGENSVQSSGTNVSITTGADNDLVYNEGNAVKIDAGDGENSVQSSGTNVSITTGADNDLIYNAGEAAIIDAGDGIDYVENSGANVSISMGAANDGISLGATAEYNLIEYANGDGNDIVVGFNSSSTLSISGGTYSKETVGNNVIVTVGDGKISLVGAASLASVNISGLEQSSEENPLLIMGDDNANKILNTLEGATIQALDGNDTVTNYADNVSIDAGAGDDSIYSENDSGVTIDAGDDNDSVISGSNNASINGGSGNDSLGNSGTNSTIIAGTGNDTVINVGNGDVIDLVEGNNVVENYTAKNTTIYGGTGDDSVSNDLNQEVGTVYIYKGGNDTLSGMGDADTLVLPQGSTYESDYSEDGYTLIIVKDASNATIGTITLEIEYGDINITDSAKGIRPVNIIYNETDASLIAGSSNKDLVENYGSNATVQTGNGKDTIYNGSDVVSVDDDGYSSGQAVYDVVMDGGADDDLLHNTGSYNTLLGGAGDDYLENYNLYGFGGYNVVMDGGNGRDFLVNSGGISSTVLGGDGNDEIFNRMNWYSEDDSSGYTGAHNASLDGGNGNDIIQNWESDNVTINGGKGNDTINNVDGEEILFGYTSGDGDDTILGFNETSTLKIGGGTGTYSKETVDNDILVTVGEGSILLKNAASLDAVQIDGVDETSPATKLITLTNGNDTYSNSVEGATIQALGGNDTIYNSSLASDVSIDGGEGDNVILNGTLAGSSGYIPGGDNVSIKTGTGNDTVYNMIAQNSTIGTGDGADFVWNTSNNVSLETGAGDDSVINALNGTVGIIGYGLNTTIDTGDGNDSVSNFADNISIRTGADNDTVSNRGNGVIIELGDGDDSIHNEGNNVEGNSVTVDAGAGNDIIDNSGDNVSVSAGAGNDTIINNTTELTNNFKAKQVTINAGTGDDSIDNTSAENTVFEYKDGDGNDTITGTYLGVASIKIGNGTTDTYHKTTDGEDVIITVGNGSILVKDVGADWNNILGTEKDPLFIEGTEGADKIANTLEGATIQSYDGNDSITNDADEVLIYADEGNDTIINTGAYVEIEGGAGNDKISLGSGAANNLIQYAATDGKDTVWGYSDDDTIKITDGSTATASVKGNNIIVTVGEGSITLKDAATGTHVNVVDANDETLIDATFYADKIVDGNSVTLTSAFKERIFTANETINNVDGSLTTNKFTLTGGGENDTLIGGKGANFINGGDGENILTGGKGNDTFVAGNGNDTITDYGVGKDKISLGAALTDFSVEDGNIVLNFDDDKSLTIQNGDGKEINFIQNGKTSTEIFTVDGKTNTAETSITLASSKESYTADTKLITIDGGLTDSVWIVGNTKANKIFGGAGDDTLNGGSGKDTLTGGDGDDIFVYETGKDVITDYVSGEDKISLGAVAISETIDKNGNVVLKFGNSNSLTINNAKEREITFTGKDGDTTKTYFSEQIVGSDGVTLQSTFKGNTFAADDELPLVDASAVTKKFTLTGGDADNTLIGGKGANLLNGGDGSDLLIGNGGNDTFVYSSGDDTIGDYETKDRISLSSAIKDFDLSGDDVIIEFNDGSLTLQDSAGKQITFVETGGKTQVNVFAADGIFNNATYKATAVTLAADISTFDAKNYSKLVSIDGGIVSSEASIVGNTKANKIYAGDAGATINGGGKNDTLWGGDGSDTFIYESGGGKDVVYGFGNEDALQIGNFTATVKDNSIAFKVGSQTNAITLKDYTATTFNINGTNYKVDGSTLTKK